MMDIMSRRSLKARTKSGKVGQAVLPCSNSPYFPFPVLFHRRATKLRVPRHFARSSLTPRVQPTYSEYCAHVLFRCSAELKFPSLPCCEEVSRRVRILVIPAERFEKRTRRRRDESARLGERVRPPSRSFQGIDQPSEQWENAERAHEVPFVVDSIDYYLMPGNLCRLRILRDNGICR